MQLEINTTFLRSFQGYCSFLSIVLGILCLAISGSTYANSEWTKLYNEIKDSLDGNTTISVIVNGHEPKTVHLPNLLKEQIFMAVSAFTVFISLTLYVIKLIGLDKYKKLVDLFGNIDVWSLWYHLMGSAALFATGVLLMLSANDIDNFAYILKQNPVMEVPIKLPNINIQLYHEKIVAGITSITNVFVFGLIAAYDRKMLPKYNKPKPKPVVAIKKNQDPDELKF